LNRIGSQFAPLSNWIAQSQLNRRFMEKFAGIDMRRPLPPFAAEPFEDWFYAHQTEGDGGKGEVVLFHDTFNNFNTPNVAMAATRLLEHAGYRVRLSNKRCCGRPMISKGMLRDAKENARWNVAQLAPYVEKNIPILGLEPSCLLTLRDEYPDFLGSMAAKRVAENSFLLEEFLVRELGKGKLSLKFNNNGHKALLHGHCHQKALVGTAPTVSILKSAGFEVSEIDSGCCGMAGSFGFEKEHYDLSLKIGNRRLAPAIKTAAANVEIVAPGISCRQQIEHLTGKKAKHPAEALWEAVSTGS
jgi:Fe-S oxidoreductase